MTNSMVPYSFIPGTKAKAGEVNANFIALADVIEKNRLTSAGDTDKINEVLETKADKTELINEHTVTKSGTDLNNYKTKGTYIFAAAYKPENIPKGEAGMLLVTGDEKSVIKQIWFCSEENPEIFTRNYENAEWSKWNSDCGTSKMTKIGYLTLQNGLIIQWGGQVGSVVTYPIAYKQFACPLLTKQGYSMSAERSDGGIIKQSLTGFNFGSGGDFAHMNWIVIGF